MLGMDTTHNRMVSPAEHNGTMIGSIVYQPPYVAWDQSNH